MADVTRNDERTVETRRMVLLTIVAEPVMEELLTEKILELGATGYTVGDIRGRGIRAADVPGHGIRIETLVSEDVAERILAHASRAWFIHYSIVAWSTPAEVVRSEKYLEK